MKKFEHPIITYLIITLVSTSIAVLLFQIGGSFAEIVNQKDLDLQFKAGGAIAGFIIIFWFSYKVISSLYKNRVIDKGFKIYVRDKSRPFNRSLTYSLSCEIYNEETGDSKTQQFPTFLDNGFVGAHIKLLENDESLNNLKVSDGSTIWDFGYFHPRQPKIDL